MFIIYLFPVLLALGIGLIPFVSNYADPAATDQAARETVRWFWGHILSGAAFGVSIIVARQISSLLAVKGAAKTGKLSFALVTLGATAMAMGLGADGIGAAAMVAGNVSPNVFFEGSGFMVIGLIMTGIVLFSLGVINQIIGLYRSEILTKRQGVVLTGCAVLIIGVSAVPSTAGLYLLAVLVLIIYGVIGRSITSKGYGER